MDLAELAVLNGLVGPLLPPLIAVINQPGWPRWGRSLATVGVCATVGTLTAAASGDLLGLSWPAAVLSCASAAITSYHVWWRRSGITDATERATSRREPRDGFWGEPSGPSVASDVDERRGSPGDAT